MTAPFALLPGGNSPASNRPARNGSGPDASAFPPLSPKAPGRAATPFGQFLLALLIPLLLATAAVAEENRPKTWAQPVPGVEVDNLFCVTPDLYRSAQPNRKEMRALAAHGIRTVINLRARHSDDDEARGTGLILTHIPARTRKVADDATVIKALQAIRDAEKPVLAHCMHGADRTGLIIAMYRMVEQGWSREAALDEMKNGGYGFHGIWTHIPEYLERVDPATIRAALQ